MDRPDSEQNEKRLQESREYWDQQASVFDESPDHGLRNDAVRAAWAGLLKTWLPEPNAAVLDIGCGTGSLSVVMARLGHTVTGIDLSPAMIAAAQAKAAAQGLAITFQVMDAAFPQLSPQQFDAIVCRHLLWTLPEPRLVLQRWLAYLKPGGRLILVEGFWSTGAGLHAQEITQMLPPALTNVTLINLSENPDLWGGRVSDERYAVIAASNH